MCELSTPAVILILLLEIIVIGIFIVRAIAKLTLDNPLKKESQEPVRFDRVPPPWFVDQWIAKNCPQVDTGKEDKEIAWLLVIVVVAIIAILYFTFS